MAFLFMLCWFAVAAVWFTISTMGMLMANDSGETTSDQQLSFIFLVLAGQAFAALAAIPAGLAFPCRGKRSLLLISAGILVIVGILIQWWAFESHLSRMAA